MPKFEITTIERWSVRATYKDVEAANPGAAAHRVMMNQASVTSHEPLLEEHTEIDQILYIDDQDGERVYDAFATAAPSLYSPPPDVADMAPPTELVTVDGDVLTIVGSTIATAAPPLVRTACPEQSRGDDLTRNAVIKRIKAALEKRSGKKWSVTGGRGTAHGWLTIDAPPARRTWHRVAKDDTRNETGDLYYGDVDGGPGFAGHTSPDDRAELAKLLGLRTGLASDVHHQGISIPSSHDHYREFIDRAEGRKPAKIAEQYWD
jgi:hypothetical protein